MSNRVKSATNIEQAVALGVWDFLIPLVLNLIFVVLSTLLLWPWGKPMLALRLTKGYGVLWVVTLLTTMLLYRLQRLFRIDSETHVNAYVISNLGHSVFLLAGWSAFAALTVHGFLTGIPAWLAPILWLIGLLSSLVAFMVLTTFYPGVLYRVVNVSLALTSFLIFAIWPAIGRVTYGWFFDLL